MGYLSEIIFLVLLIILLWALLMKMIFRLRQENDRNKKEIIFLRKEKDEYEDLGKGLAEYNRKLQKKKNLAKSKIMLVLKKQNKISNHDVVKLLEISSATAVRYFDELEKEGKLKQIGKTGQKVFYAKSK